MSFTKSGTFWELPWIDVVDVIDYDSSTIVATKNT